MTRVRSTPTALALTVRPKRSTSSVSNRRQMSTSDNTLPDVLLTVRKAANYRITLETKFYQIQLPKDVQLPFIFYLSDKKLSWNYTKIISIKIVKWVTQEIQRCTKYNRTAILRTKKFKLSNSFYQCSAVATLSHLIMSQIQLLNIRRFFFDPRKWIEFFQTVLAKIKDLQLKQKNAVRKTNSSNFRIKGQRPQRLNWIRNRKQCLQLRIINGISRTWGSTTASSSNQPSFLPSFHRQSTQRTLSQSSWPIECSDLKPGRRVH